jgi:uncharacterized membrane protein
MPQLSQAKTLGGLGSIFMLLSFVPTVGWILAIAGGVMVLVAIKYISEVFQDNSIFNNMLLAIILGIVGIIVGIAVILGTVLTTIGLGNLQGWFSSLPKTPGFYSYPVPSGGLLPLIEGALAGLAIIWVLLLVSAIFLRRSYTLISQKLGVGMFGTTGLIYMIGAALVIVGVGIILLFVALILNVVAFFSIPDQPMPQSVPQQPTRPATM